MSSIGGTIIERPVLESLWNERSEKNQARFDGSFVNEFLSHDLELDCFASRKIFFVRVSTAKLFLSITRA